MLARWSHKSGYTFSLIILGNFRLLREIPPLRPTCTRDGIGEYLIKHEREEAQKDKKIKN